jgi:hypothetical protein
VACICCILILNRKQNKKQCKVLDWMKRRDFGLLAGTSLATTALAQPVRAQSATPDPNLLDTT